MDENILDKFREIQNLTSWDAYQATCHLFIAKNDNFESFGSGVFVKVLENHFLFTVAHVAEGLDFELHIGIEKNTMYKLGGNLVTNNTENRDNDKFDICVLKLCNETIKNISNVYNFIDINEIEINHEFKELPLYELVGFPATKSKYNPYNKKLYSKAYRYITSAVNQSEIYKKLKCNPSFNVILNYDRKKVLNIKKKTTQLGPELYGMSGCGLWYTPISEINFKDKPKKYLVAIITEWPIKERKYLITTKIDLFTETIRQYFNINIEKSKVQFNVNK